MSVVGLLYVSNVQPDHYRNNPNEKNQNCVLLKLSDFHYLYYSYASNNPNHFKSRFDHNINNSGLDSTFVQL